MHRPVGLCCLEPLAKVLSELLALSTFHGGLALLSLLELHGVFFDLRNLACDHLGFPLAGFFELLVNLLQGNWVPLGLLLEALPDGRVGMELLVELDVEGDRLGCGLLVLLLHRDIG